MLNQTKISIKKLSDQIKQVSEVIKYVEQYQAYKPVHGKYLKVKNQEAFFRKHEPELLLFDGAQAMLKRAGVNPDRVSPADLRKRLGQLEQAKETAVQNRNQVQKRIKTLQENHKNLHRYFEKDKIPRAITQVELS